ncbi:CDP-glucose 4,6-dehydratase [Parasedimentitalea huanghaiensis]|uniref:CDP-glucose 4,6-dehydratase n=1 Tax=Parasedimentitalea huanghaiensis TaxID=2682100 RepID=A0A6L6WMV4_9RHOB|nr:CDP-glucose 4,6-dehydratase [Zongyanglinia huanghaiensis]MVO18620.1 CDP-glucose 4,6-dehydratase [Zongyanglinia huanghaiensis]
MENLEMSNFWDGKRVLVTGHTGFKGSWLSFWLKRQGANVAGMSLMPDTAPALFDQLEVETLVDHMIGDIRDAELVARRVAEVEPDVVFHLAAQPLVIESYATPLKTWQTNVMGSVHIMEALRNLTGRCAVVMVTTDKVYENHEDGKPYDEQHALGGHDPYSASKAAMEIAVSSWRRSFLGGTDIRMASARAGNVIGGGDWAANRIVPDIVRALKRGQPIDVRNPNAVRPWQHVLEPLAGYLALAEKLWSSDDPVYQSGFNFGPNPKDARPVGDLVTEALRHWPGQWVDASPEDAVHEAGLLSLDPAKCETLLGVRSRWTFEQTIKHTINWYRAVGSGQSAIDITAAQLSDFGGL